MQRNARNMLRRPFHSKINLKKKYDEDRAINPFLLRYLATSRIFKGNSCFTVGGQL